MLTIFKKYSLVESLHENERYIVYRAKRIDNNDPVIIKMVKPDTIDNNAALQLQHEYHILSMLEFDSIPKILEIMASPSINCIIFEDIGATSLHDLLLDRTFDLRESLTIAIQLAKTLIYLHQKHILHADINPNNLVYNPSTQSMMLIDYGYSIIDNNFSININSTVGTSGNLLYMSPEQTGRTQQKIDLRSDLYSMGMTLYHLFSGQAPFDAKNRYELIHKQIALTPIPLSELDQDIPQIISDIVSKLIEKHPDARYSNDESLIHDLEKCLYLLEPSGTIRAFKIGQTENRFSQIGDRLYGRTEELNILNHALNQMIKDEHVSILVSGASGVGKTRLIEELFVYTQSSQLTVIKGKFELHQVALPYTTFKQIFAQLSTLLLSRYSHHQTISLSPNSTKILNYLFAELRTILKSTLTYNINTLENLSNKLPFALQEFFSVIVTAEYPLIIFIDDLQWANPESLDLIQKVFLNYNNPHLHFIGSYRDEEGQKSRIRNIFYEKNNLIEIDLLPLKKEDFVDILEDILTDKGKKVQTLGKILYEKTAGNPFYLKTIIENLIEIGELVFAKDHWQYSNEKIKVHSFSSNMAAIIKDKFQSLHTDESEYLKYLALFGSRYNQEFTIEMMEFFGYSRNIIESLKKQKFLELTKKEYAFVHDQIQEHIYQVIDPITRHHLHQEIGHYLEQAHKRGSYNDITTMVYHLNHGYKKGKFSKKLFQLNITALSEMVNNTFYDLALKQIHWIDEYLFDDTTWANYRNLAYNYCYLRSRILYLNSLHDEALSQAKFLFSVTRTVNERLECFTLIKNICVTQGRNFSELLGFGNVILKELSLHVPSDTTQLNNTLILLKQKIEKHPLFENTKTILTLPITKHSKHRQAASLLVDYWEAAYYLADVPLMQWAYLTIVASSFTHGNTSESSFGYVLLGGQLVSEKRYKQGYDFGHMALKLNALLNDKIMLPKIHNFMANFINPYVKPLRSNINLYQKSLHQSKINGDIVFGTWANFLMHLSDYLSGSSLSKVHDNLTLNSLYLLQSGDTKMIAIFTVLTQTVQSLQSPIQEYHFEESTAISMWEKDNFYPALAWYAILKAQTCLIKGSFEEGLSYFERYLHSEANEVIMFPKIRLHFIRALLLMGKSNELTPNEESILQNDLAECDSIIHAASTNYNFERLLLKAERIKQKSNMWDVAHVYDAALKAAQDKKNPFYGALAGLCASRFWNSMFFNDLKDFYLNEAITRLHQWGAYAIASTINDCDPSPKDVAETDIISNSFSKHSSIKIESPNFTSLLNSFYAISKSLNSNELITTLMQTILENATASRAILLIKEEDEFYTKSSIDFRLNKIEMSNILFSQYQLIPQTIIQYAINTGKNVLLNTPNEAQGFSNDEYIQIYKPASCNVITSSIEGNIHAILYLENESISTPLEHESVRILELLLTQAAIVLKNTSLYETLKISEEKLNKAQEISHIGSWQFNASTGKIEWSAEVYRIYGLEPFGETIDFDWFVDHLHPDDISLVSENVGKALSAHKSYNVIHRIRTVDGREKIVHQKAEVYWESNVQYMAGTIQDITQSQQAQIQISRLSQVVNQNPFSTIITDTDGIIQYVNAQCLTMTGYFEQELIGKRMKIFSSGIHPPEFYADLWDTISVKKMMWRGTIINKMKNKSHADCSSTIFPIFDANHDVTNFVTIQENVTEYNIKKKIFMMQTRQAQMGEMLSMIAHQWRQPLAVIGALMNKQRINIILDNYSIEEILESMDSIDTQVQYLSRTITDFKDFFKPDKQMTPTTSSTMFTKALNLIEHSFKYNKIQLKMAHHNDKVYLTYENEVVQVLLNLLKNAQDMFIGRKITNPQLTIHTNQQDKMILISVEDNAQGIDSTVIDTLFLPYVSTKDEQNGTGLGLYMSKIIIEEHCNGSMHAENTFDGAKFVITMPIKEQ